MTYLEHLRFALFLFRTLAGCSIASLVHAIFPFLLVTYTSSHLKELNEIFSKRISSDKASTQKAVRENMEV
jgi:hypothetical protein